MAVTLRRICECPIKRLLLSFFPTISEPLRSRLSRRGGMKMRPTVSSSMVLMQDSLEEHVGPGGPRGQGESHRHGSRMLQRPAGTMASQSKRPRPFTARIVVMGDDRALGRLANAYYCLR